jgi:hypothetical protein
VTEGSAALLVAKRERVWRSPHEDVHGWLGADIRNANPEAEADLVLRLYVGGRPTGLSALKLIQLRAAAG